MLITNYEHTISYFHIFIKGFSNMCKFAHIMKFKVVSIYWNLCILY